MIENGEDAGKSSSSAPASSSTKEEIRTVAHKIAAQQVQISKPGVWGVLTAISEKARKRSQGMHILLHGNEHILGRTVKEASCQFESPNVSGRHCKVYRKKVVLENTDQSDSMCCSVFLKDSSSNGTYLNWEKLKKDSPEAQIQHGDIISLVNPPDHENAFAFVFREIRQELSSHLQNSMPNTPAKRKASVADIFGEDIVGDGKRIKGLGIGGPEGPVSLDDVRRLQRSNEELRQQLEAHVLTIEKLHNEARAAAAQHDIELKELRESISASFLEQIKEFRHEVATKEKDVEEITALSTQRKSCIEDLSQRLAAASQSRTDAEEIIQSQKTTIAELEQQLEEERSQRRDEREKAEADLKAAVERVRLEALDELKRQSEAAARQHKEQIDVITKLQESDKENRVLMETLRSKLEDVRESLMKSEKKARQLEVQLHEEESSSASARKKAAEKEHELQRIKMELEKEKAAREDAWAKVSILELEMAAAIRDLGLEKQRLQGARERIVLRETQLRAFHATAEEIAALQQKQQDQLNGMLRTLEDGENCELPNIDDEFETRTENLCGAVTRVREEIRAGNIGSDGILGDGAASDEAETPKKDGETECSSDSSSVEKCNTNKITIVNTLEDWENGDTQEDCADTIQITPKNSRHDTEVMDTMLNQDDEQIGTEQVLATEAEATQLIESSGGGKRPEHHVYATGSEPARSRKTSRGRILEDDQMEDCEGDLGGEKMQAENEKHAQMCWEGKEITAENQRTTLTIRIDAEPEKVPDMAKTSEHPTTACHSIRNTVNQDGQRLCPGNWQEVDEMASKLRKDRNTITTNDLLTSEVPGSWALSTPGSFHCDNESLRSDERKPGIGRASDEGLHQDFDASQIGAPEHARSRQDTQLNGLMRDQDMQPEITPTAGSQNYPVPSLGSRQSREHQALTEMIGIVDPDFRHRHRIRSSNGNAPDTEEDDTEMSLYSDEFIGRPSPDSVYSSDKLVEASKDSSKEEDELLIVKANALYSGKKSIDSQVMDNMDDKKSSMSNIFENPNDNSKCAECKPMKGNVGCIGECNSLPWKHEACTATKVVLKIQQETHLPCSREGAQSPRMLSGDVIKESYDGNDELTTVKMMREGSKTGNPALAQAVDDLNNKKYSISDVPDGENDDAGSAGCKALKGNLDWCGDPGPDSSPQRHTGQPEKTPDHKERSEGSSTTAFSVALRTELHQSPVQSEIKQLILRIRALEDERQSMKQAIMYFEKENSSCLALLKEIARQHYEVQILDERRTHSTRLSPSEGSILSIIKWILSYIFRRAVWRCQSKYMHRVSSNGVGLLFLLDNTSYRRLGPFVTRMGIYKDSIH